VTAWGFLCGLSVRLGVLGGRGQKVRLGSGFERGRRGVFLRALRVLFLQHDSRARSIHEPRNASAVSPLDHGETDCGSTIPTSFFFKSARSINI
jgi:hypothetical protein